MFLLVSYMAILFMLKHLTFSSSKNADIFMVDYV